MDFSQRLSEIMSERNISAYRLAKEIAVHQTTIKNWLDGKTPRIEHMQKIADYFNVSIEWLTGASPYRTVFEQIDSTLDIEKMQRDIAEAEKVDTSAFVLDPEDLREMEEETQRDIDRYALTEKDEKDIAKELNNIMGKMRSGDDGPLRYEGAEIDDESMNLLEAAINMTLKQLKRENKEKYDPYKNKR